MPYLNRSDTFSGFQSEADVGLHFGGQPIPIHSGLGGVPHGVGAQGRKLGDLLLAFAAGPEMPVDAQPGEAAKVVAGVEGQVAFVGMIHYDLLRLMNLRILVRALAMWERTVALEQSRRRATSSAGRSSTSRRTKAVRSRGVRQLSPASRYSRCSPRSRISSGLSHSYSGAS